MATPSTPRFTVPDSNRARAPGLPAEIVLKIVEFAQAGQSRREQLRTKHTLELVCKDWFIEDERWRKVVVETSAQLAGVCAVLTSLSAAEAGAGGEGGAGEAKAGSVAGAVKALYATLDGGDADSQHVLELVLSMVNLSTVELKLTATSPSAARLDEVVDNALAGLANLSHLLVDRRETYVRKDFWSSTPAHPNIWRCRRAEHKVGDSRLPNWDIFLRFDWEEQDKKSERRDNVDYLRSVQAWMQRADVFDADSHACELARGVDEATLITHETLPRGQFDNLVASLDEVTELTISPCVVSDIAALAQLQRLKSLCVYDARDGPALQPAEFIALFAHSTSLDTVTLAPEIAFDWTELDKQQVESAAQPNIKLIWFDPVPDHYDDDYDDDDDDDDDDESITTSD